MELDDELEAAESVFGEAVRVLERGAGGASVSFDALPAGCAVEECFVRCTVEVALLAAGGAPVRVALRDADGLEDAARDALAARLTALAAELGSRQEPALLAVLGEAMDALAEANVPAGPCAVCLAPVAAAPRGAYCRSTACYHAFHSVCFASYWRWRQREVAELQAAPRAFRVGVASDDAAGPDVAVRCPVCRTEVTEADVAHLQRWLKPGRKAQAAAEAHPEPSDDASVLSLDTADLAKVRRQQERMAALFAAQRRRDGCVRDDEATALDDDTERLARSMDAARIAASGVPEEPTRLAASEAPGPRESSGFVVHAEASPEVFAARFGDGKAARRRRGRGGRGGRGNSDGHQVPAEDAAKGRGPGSGESRARGPCGPCRGVADGCPVASAQTAGGAEPEIVGAEPRGSAGGGRGGGGRRRGRGRGRWNAGSSAGAAGVDSG